MPQNKYKFDMKISFYIWLIFINISHIMCKMQNKCRLNIHLDRLEFEGLLAEYFTVIWTNYKLTISHYVKQGSLETADKWPINH